LTVGNIPGFAPINIEVTARTYFLEHESHAALAAYACEIIVY
jgi:hypothetical protein